MLWNPRKVGLWLLAVTGVRFFLLNHRFEGDTRALLSGSKAALGCLLEGRFAACPDVQHFPLFQYLPGIVLQSFGIGDRALLIVFTLASSIFFFGLLAMFISAFTQSKTPALGTIGVLVLLGSPLLWYAFSTFNEVTAGFLAVLLLYLILKGSSSIYIFVAFVAASITKEIAFPFLLLLSFLVLQFGGLSNTRVARVRTSILSGAIVAFILNSAFNWFRFGTVINLSNFQRKFMVPSIFQKLSSGFAIWFSPNGGLFFFWPCFVILFFGCLWVACVRGVKRPVNIGILVIALFLTVGFSSWYAPMGWVAWGPRLILPWIPALLFVIFLFFGEWVSHFSLKLTATQPRAIMTAVIVGVMTLPQLLVLFVPHVLDGFFKNDSFCPGTAYVDQPDYYYRCLNYRFWEKKPFLIFGVFDSLSKPIVLIHSLIYFIGILSLVFSIRNQISRLEDTELGK